MRPSRLALAAFLALAACSSSDPSPSGPSDGGAGGAGGAGGGDGRAQVPADFDVQAHGGGQGLKPDNTLPAFETALDLGVDTLEGDLHFTSDGVVVIWHDDHIDPAKCGVDPAAAAPLPPDPDALPLEDPSLMLSALDLATLQKYRCDRNPDPGAYPTQDSGPTALAGDDYRIQRLDDLFAFVAAYASSPDKTPEQQGRASTIRFNIETKRDTLHPEYINDGFDGTSPGPFEQAVVDAVALASLTARVTVQSFDHRSLWAVRQLEPGIALSALTSFGLIDFADVAARGAGVWSPHHSMATPELILEAQAAGLRVVPWTVNEEDDMRDLIANGVDGIITDYPDLLLDIIVRAP